MIININSEIKTEDVISIEELQLEILRLMNMWAEGYETSLLEALNFNLHGTYEKAKIIDYDADTGTYKFRPKEGR